MQTGSGTHPAVGFAASWLCFLAGIGIAACGSSASSTTSTAPSVNAAPLTRIRASVDVTQAARTAHLVTAGTVQEAAGPNPSGVQHTVGTGDVSFADPKIELETAAVPPTSPFLPVTRVLRIGDSVYVSMPGDRWKRSDILAEHVNFLGVLTPSTIANTKGPVTVLGTSTIDGQPAVEFGVPMPGLTSTRSTSGHVEERIALASFVVHVWLDSRGRIVQTSVSQSAKFTPVAGASGVAMASSSYISTSKVTLSKFGEPVHLSLRIPANQG
jgi:hypothetical protein